MKDYWKHVAVAAISVCNILSMIASCQRERLVYFEIQRLIMVDDAQEFAKRSLGIAEMEAMRANDIEARYKTLKEYLESLEVE